MAAPLLEPRVGFCVTSPGAHYSRLRRLRSDANRGIAHFHPQKWDVSQRGGSELKRLRNPLRGWLAVLCVTLRQVASGLRNPGDQGDASTTPARWQCKTPQTPQPAFRQRMDGKRRRVRRVSTSSNGQRGRAAARVSA